MPTLALTAAAVSEIPLLDEGQMLYRDGKLQGFGLRVGATVKTYFVEKRVDGRNVRHSLGIHGQITADQARKLAAIKLGEMTKGTDLNVAKKVRRESIRAEKAQAKATTDYSLRKLCEAYIARQNERGKTSAQDAANLFGNYVYESEFAGLPARDLTGKQATALLRVITEKGKLRTAAKLRSYMRAAYALAQGAETNAEAPGELLLFGIDTNPIASTGALSSGNNTRDVVLTEAELGEVLRLLAERRMVGHDDALAALELSLVLGGQRLAQVLRVTVSDVDMEGGTITLFDGKGKRQTPRKHVLPLTETAAQLVERILAMRRAEWLFGDCNAQTVPTTVAKKGSQIIGEAQRNVAKALGGSPRPPAQARDLRRSCETMMAAMGVSKDIRAQLQSHGLGGIQDRHYDRHDYLEEKRRALEAWEARLISLASRQPAPSNVRKLKRAARSAA